jgi:co-chaperonin GroES (HSP10)
LHTQEILEPLFDYVLVRRDIEEETPGGLIIPKDTAKKHSSYRADIIALGPSCEADVAPGDTVIFGQYAGSWVNAEGKNAARAGTETYIIRETDIIAKVKSK